MKHFQNKIWVISILAICSFSARGAVEKNWFQDQEQYENYYNYKYYANIVEFLIHECTGSRSISYKLGFIVADISQSYELDLLKTPNFGSVFSDRNSFQEAAIEIRLMVTRNPDTPGGEGDPIHDAHREVLKIFREFSDERDLICDFIFWDEVRAFERASDIFMEDTRARFEGSRKFSTFRKETKESTEKLLHFFSENPLIDE